MNTIPAILALDIGGQASHWITYEDYATQFCKGNIAWIYGEEEHPIHGGTSRMTGEQSRIDMAPIVAIRGLNNGRRGTNTVRTPNKVSKRELFRRDNHTCAYCGNVFIESKLEMEHVIPDSRGGPASWSNLVSSCKRCNNHKRDRTPEEAGMKLLYVPYTPCRAEWLILSNRRILIDQMDFLRSQVKAKVSRIHQLEAA